MEADQLEFAYKLRSALDQNLDNLPAPTSRKLAFARNAAIKHKKRDSPMGEWSLQRKLTGNVGNFFSESRPWAGRMAFAVSVIVVAAGLAGIWQSEQQRYLNETADIDASILVDELPLVAYLDDGFNAYLDNQ